MRKLFGILVILMGLASAGLFYDAGKSLGKSATELTGLRSRGGETVAEAYYQKIGEYGVAYSKLANALAIAALMVSFGIGGLLLTSNEQKST